MRPILAVVFVIACGAAGSPPGWHPAARCTVAPAPSLAHPAAMAAGVPSPAPAGKLPVGCGDFGTANPALVHAADEDERWMALCQARRDTDGDGKIAVRFSIHGDVIGDAMEQYLILGGGDGTRIDAFAGGSDDGRWLAIVRDGKVELVDALTGDVFELPGADAESDDRPGAPHRAARFAGNRLLYIRHDAAGDDRLVVHDPANHAEREIVISGRIWRIDGGGSDRIAQVYTVPQGESLPRLHSTLAKGECLGPWEAYSTHGMEGPTPTEHWIDLDSGTEVPGDGGQIAVGSTLVRTPADGALYFGADQIAPPSCHAKLLAVLPAPVRAMAICGEHQQAKIVLLGKDLHQELASIDRDHDYPGRLNKVISTSEMVCTDQLHCVTSATNHYRHIHLEDGLVEYAWGTKLYVVRRLPSSESHEIIDVATGKRRPIRSAARAAGGRFVVDHDFNLVDLDTATIVGKVPGAIRVNAPGHVLWGAAGDSGPMRWIAP